MTEPHFFSVENASELEKKFVEDLEKDNSGEVKKIYSDWLEDQGRLFLANLIREGWIQGKAFIDGVILTEARELEFTIYKTKIGYHKTPWVLLGRFCGNCGLTDSFSRGGFTNCRIPTEFEIKLDKWLDMQASSYSYKFPSNTKIIFRGVKWGETKCTAPDSTCRGSTEFSCDNYEVECNES